MVSTEYRNDDEYIAQLRRFQPRQPCVPPAIAATPARAKRRRYPAVAALVLLGALLVPVARRVSERPSRVDLASRDDLLQAPEAAAESAVPAQSLAPVPSLPTSVDGPYFDVASVRQNPPNDQRQEGSINLQGGRYLAVNRSLKQFISVAYAPTSPASSQALSLPEEQIDGGPAWIDNDRFTIEALAGRPITRAELGAMLRRLLAERFGLKVRVDRRLVSVYDLVRADNSGKPAPRLRDSEKCGADSRQTIAGGGGRMILACTGMPMLAGILSEAVGRPVIDQTGLTGRYDGTLEYAAMEEDITGPRGPLRVEELLPPPPAASIFTAVQEQFGLKLVSQRRQLEYLVIESVRRPTLN